MHISLLDNLMTVWPEIRRVHMATIQWAKTLIQRLIRQSLRRDLEPCLDGPNVEVQSGQSDEQPGTELMETWEVLLDLS